MNLWLLLAIGIFAISWFTLRPIIFAGEGSYYDKETAFLLITITIIIPISLIFVASFVNETVSSVRKFSPRLSIRMSKPRLSVGGKSAPKLSKMDFLKKVKEW